MLVSSEGFYKMIMRPMLQLQLASQKNSPASQQHTELLTPVTTLNQWLNEDKNRECHQLSTPGPFSLDKQRSSHWWWWATWVIFLYQCTAEAQNKEYSLNQSCCLYSQGRSLRQKLFYSIFFKLTNRTATVLKDI